MTRDFSQVNKDQCRNTKDMNKEGNNFLQKKHSSSLTLGSEKWED